MSGTVLKQYIVDAFTDTVFKGNPAAICVLDQWLPDNLMQSITKENNLSETAFTVKNGENYDLRWFTPGGEIDLCGHATLACAYVLMNYYEQGKESVAFSTMSGKLTVVRRGNLYEMDFPAYDLKQIPVTKEMTDAIGIAPKEAYIGRDLLCVFENTSIIKSLAPDLEKVKGLEGLLLQVTARTDGEAYDCISRSFAPKLNVAEDPVCGSGHCHIIPYWAKKLLKNGCLSGIPTRRRSLLPFGKRTGHTGWKSCSLLAGGHLFTRRGFQLTAGGAIRYDEKRNYKRAYAACIAM